MARCKNHTNQRRCFTISLPLSVSLSSVGTAACARTMPSAICHCPSPYRSQCQSQWLLHPLRNGHTQSVTVTVHIKPMIVVVMYCVISWLCKKQRKKKKRRRRRGDYYLFVSFCLRNDDDDDGKEQNLLHAHWSSSLSRALLLRCRCGCCCLCSLLSRSRCRCQRQRRRSVPAQCMSKSLGQA